MKTKQLNIKRNIVLTILTFLSLSVFCIKLDLIDIETLEGSTRIIKFFEKCIKSINGYNVAYIPMFIAFYYFYSKNYFKGDKINKVSMVLAIFFSAMMVLGYSYWKEDNWDLVFGNGFQLMKSTIVALGYYTMFYILIKKFYEWLEKSEKKENKNKLVDFIFEKHSFIMPFAVILLFWLPYIIAFYPGTTPGTDTMSEIYSFYHMDNYTVDSINLISEDVYINGHHSVLHNMILGGFIKIGEILNNYNIGMFLYTIVQVIITAIVYSYTFVWMKKRKIPVWIRILALGIYSLLSFIPMFAINTGKDNYSSILILLYIIMLCDATIDKEKLNKKKHCLSLGGVMLLIMMFRNDGIYRVIIPFIFFIIVNKKIWRKGIALLLVTVLLFEIYSNVLLPALKITDGSVREMLSIPFQQTARVVAEHGEDAYSKEEQEIIYKILDYENLGKDYNPILSDPVKNKFNKNASKEDLINFLKVWISNFFKYPQDYIQAGLNHTYIYFYPDKNQNIGYTTISGLDDGKFNINFVEKFQNARDLIEYGHKTIKKLPVIGMIYSVGFHVDFLLISIGYLIHKKKFRFVPVLLPLVIVAMINLVSPVNGSWRYSLPIIMSFPIILAIISYASMEDRRRILVFNHKKEKKNERFYANTKRSYTI